MEGELSLTTMPREMMEEVLSHLSSTRDNSAASSVCKSWKRMVAKLWSLLDATDVQNFEYFATLDLSPSRFKGIKSLKLKNCERLTTGVLLNLTKKVPNLTHLNLKGCTRLTPYALKTILRTYGTQLTSLKVNHVKDAAKVLSECECGLKLTELSVSGMNLSETMKLLDVPKATSISCDSGFRGDVRLSEFEVLESLSLECGVATNQLPQLLAKNAATLRKLRLSGLYLTVDIINVISSIPGLEELVIHKFNLLSLNFYEMADIIRTKMNALIRLELIPSSDFYMAFPPDYFTHSLPNLRRLKLFVLPKSEFDLPSGLEHLGLLGQAKNEWMERIMKSCCSSRLTRLEIHIWDTRGDSSKWWGTITEQALSLEELIVTIPNTWAPRNFHKLHKLKRFSAYGFSDAAFGAICKSLGQLSSLEEVYFEGVIPTSWMQNVLDSMPPTIQVIRFRCRCHTQIAQLVQIPFLSQMQQKFKKLRQIYGIQPLVSQKTFDEIQQRSDLASIVVGAR